MAHKDRKCMFKKVEKLFIKYQSLFIDIKLQVCDSDDARIILERDENNLQIKTRTKTIESTSYKIKEITNDDKFKVSWGLVHNQNLFPWHLVRYKFWKSNECFQEYISAIKDQEEFVAEVLSSAELREIYIKFCKSKIGKFQNQTFLKHLEQKEKYKEQRNSDFMDTEDTAFTERMNSQPP